LEHGRRELYGHLPARKATVKIWLASVLHLEQLRPSRAWLDGAKKRCAKVANDHPTHRTALASPCRRIDVIGAMP